MVSLLRQYHEDLIKFTSKVNLISGATIKTADEVHIADSIMAGQIILADCHFKKIHDIGSGNGCPGLILAIMDSSREYVLVDRDTRKIEFLKTMVTRLGLSHVSVLCSPVESLPNGSIECAVSRAYASISKSLLTTRNKFVGKGRYYHMKSSQWYLEMAEMPVQLCALWEAASVGSYTLPDSGVESNVISLSRLK